MMIVVVMFRQPGDTPPAGQMPQRTPMLSGLLRRVVAAAVAQE